MIGALTDAWRRAVHGSPRINQIAWLESHSNLPRRFPRHSLLLVGGTEESPKWAAFECPCGTGHRIMLPLRNNAGPVWQVTFDGGVPSVHPSVDDQADRRCHFWLLAGRVHWAPDRSRGRRVPHSEAARQLDVAFMPVREAIEELPATEADEA